jgi:hypothetical protein
MSRVGLCVFVLVLIARSAPAETFEVGSDSQPFGILAYAYCLIWCPIEEPFSWVKGKSKVKSTFWPDRIKIDTNPTSAQVQIFFRPGYREDKRRGLRRDAVKRFQGTTPITLRAAPYVGFGEKAYFTAIMFKQGYKPLIKEIKVSGSAHHVFKLEPIPQKGAASLQESSP